MTPRDRPTPPEIRESQLAIDRGPAYQGLAEELSRRLHRLRLEGQDADYRIACGKLAIDCDAAAQNFSSWGPLSDTGKRFLVQEWQDIKARARRLGLEIL